MGRDYDLNFDLAAFDYSTLRNAMGAATAVVDEAFREELDLYTGSTARIHVKPVLAGRGLTFLPAESATRSLEIDLTRLRTPPTDWRREDPLPAVADKVRAVRVRIGVKTTETGCASVGLSIWNDALDRPIDHLVRTVQVGGDLDDPGCVGDRSKRIQGSLISLLAIAPDARADAALHVFEMAPGADDPKSIAVFVARDSPVLSWVLARQLSKFVTEPTGLLTRLSVARSSRNYAALARELKEVLFHGESQSEQRQADRAFDLLSALARRAERPTVFVRLADVKGRSLFLPLGLTAINGGRLLGESVVVTQPLPRETYAGGGRCIGAWKMVLPESLGAAVAGDFLTPVTTPMPNRTSSWSEFESYLRGSAAAAAGPEGLLLLAHQAGGRIWFLPDTDSSILSEQISHRFAPGSVAVLSACSVGDLNAESSGVGLLERLNGQGIDAAIVSPFAVRGTVGARFAFHFANEVAKAQRAGEAATLGELFRRAVQETRNDPRIAAERNGVHEFLLAGNGGLRLCR